MYVQIFSQGNKVKWIPGVIVEQIGRVVFRVRLQTQPPLLNDIKIKFEFVYQVIFQN